MKVAPIGNFGTDSRLLEAVIGDTDRISIIYLYLYFSIHNRKCVMGQIRKSTQQYITIYNRTFNLSALRYLIYSTFLIGLHRVSRSKDS